MIADEQHGRPRASTAPSRSAAGTRPARVSSTSQPRPSWRAVLTRPTQRRSIPASHASTPALVVSSGKRSSTSATWTPDPVVGRRRPLARLPVEAAVGDPAHGGDDVRVVGEGEDDDRPRPRPLGAGRRSGVRGRAPSAAAAGTAPVIGRRAPPAGPGPPAGGRLSLGRRARRRSANCTGGRVRRLPDRVARRARGDGPRLQGPPAASGADGRGQGDHARAWPGTPTSGPASSRRRRWPRRSSTRT